MAEFESLYSLSIQLIWSWDCSIVAFEKKYFAFGIQLFTIIYYPLASAFVHECT